MISAIGVFGFVLVGGKSLHEHTLGWFSSETLEKIKIPHQYATGGHLGRIYPEGEDDLTSLGGR